MTRRQEVERDQGSSSRTRAVRRFALGTQELKLGRDNTLSQQNEQQSLIEDDVAEIVHDFKSPLSAITLEAIVLADRLLRGETVEGLQSIARINRNVAYLDRLILDLLDVCSVSAGQLRLSLEPTELRSLIEDVVDRVLVAEDRARVVIVAEQPITLLLDRHRIERVIANLLDNAFKYGSSTTTVEIRLSTSSYPRGACIAVSDTGPGIAPSDLALIFNRHRRADSSRGRPGTGLGLYVCRKFVEAHGGQIGVDSVSGVGSRFFFRLPAC